MGSDRFSLEKCLKKIFRARTFPLDLWLIYGERGGPWLIYGGGSFEGGGWYVGHFGVWLETVRVARHRLRDACCHAATTLDQKLPFFFLGS